MLTKQALRTLGMAVLLTSLALIFTVYFFREALFLHERFSLSPNDPIFADAKSRFELEHRSYVEGAGENLTAIRIGLPNRYCVKFYSSRPFSYSRDTPLYCYDKNSGEYAGDVN